MANILLIYPKPDEEKKARFGFSLSLLYLSSILKKAGHKTFYKDYSVEKFSIKGLEEQLNNTQIAVVEFDSFPLKRSTNLYSAHNMVQLMRELKPSIKIIAFGKDCILFPRKVMYADFTFNCDPEPLICKIVNMLLNNISNIDEMLLTEDKTITLNSLPVPDRTLLSEIAEHGGTVNRKPLLAKSTLIQTSRGCLNKCIFCQRQGWDAKIKFQPIDYVLNEFKEIKHNNYVNVWVCDDNFAFNLPRAKRIFRGLVRQGLTSGMKLSLSSWTKIDFDFLDLAKKANVSLISFGIESANSHILNFYQKDIDLKYAESLISYADSIGIYTVGNFIIGAPMETEETINNTFNYALKVPFDQVNIKILDYMAGSKMYKQLDEDFRGDRRHIFACKENGLNIFPIAYLKEKINYFNNEFNDIRSTHLRIKIKKFGFPYEFLTNKNY